MSKSTIRNIIISLVFMAGSVLVFWLMTYQVVEQGEKLREQVTILEEEQMRDKNFKKLEKISEESSFDREELKSHFLFNEGDTIDFLSTIESLAPKVGVTIDSAKTSLSTITDKETEQKWIVISISFSGSRDDSKRYIKTLEALPQVLRITSIDTKANPSTGWQTNLTMQVRVLSYDE